MKTMTVSYDTVPVPVRVPDDLAGVMEHIATVKRGRFGVITGHQSGIDNPKCVRPTVSDITFVTNPRYDKWLERMTAAVKAIEFLPFISNLNPDRFAAMKAKDATSEDLFNTAKNDILASLAKSQDGDGSDAHRLGHRLCYATFDAGDVPVKCHLVTEDDGTGHKRPVVDGQGMMEVSSIMLPFFAVARKVTSPGEWKPTNSRALTLMKDAIKDATGIPEWKTISVGKGNFKTLTMDKTTVYGMICEPLKVQVNAPAADLFAYIAGMAEGFWSALQAMNEAATVRR